ncbi:hypothetical protein WJX79_007908 [Trebouxia sp. C0005]
MKLATVSVHATDDIPNGAELPQKLSIASLAKHAGVDKAFMQDWIASVKVPSEEATALSRMADAAAAAAAFTAEGLRDDLHRPSQQAQRAELAKRAQQASDAVLRGGDDQGLDEPDRRSYSRWSGMDAGNDDMCRTSSAVATPESSYATAQAVPVSVSRHSVSSGHSSRKGHLPPVYSTSPVIQHHRLHQPSALQSATSPFATALPFSAALPLSPGHRTASPQADTPRFASLGQANPRKSVYDSSSQDPHRSSHALEGSALSYGRSSHALMPSSYRDEPSASAPQHLATTREGKVLLHAAHRASSHTHSDVRASVYPNASSGELPYLQASSGASPMRRALSRSPHHEAVTSSSPYRQGQTGVSPLEPEAGYSPGKGYSAYKHAASRTGVQHMHKEGESTNLSPSRLASARPGPEGGGAWSPLPQGHARSWRALGNNDASSDLQASMYHRERSRLQEALARQHAASAATSTAAAADPLPRSGSPWDSAWDQQSAATRGHSHESHGRQSHLSSARHQEHSRGVFGSIVNDYRSSSRSDSRHPSPQLSVLALEEAETLQQRAERKRGREAVSAYEQAASRFRRALDLQQRSPLRFERHCDAYFGLAEVLQKWAEAVLAVCRTLPDADLTRDVEQQASNAAQPLFRQSVEAYQQVRTGMQEMRADAAVNSGNTLAAWAELLPAGAAVQMLASAQKAYEAALTQEEDAATWGNRADALVRQAELLAEVTPAQLGENAVGQSFAEALQAYEKACSMTSSEQGDDLPGLLHNWGVGLRSMADLQQDAEAACNIFTFPRKRNSLQTCFAISRNPG